MTVVTIPKIDLEKVFIDFGPENGEKIYEKYLCSLSNRERGELLGYTMRCRGTTFATRMIKEGRYRASRLKKMCDERHINSKEIISEFNPRVIRWGYNCWVEVEEPLKDATLSALCDEHDNKS